MSPDQVTTLLLVLAILGSAFGAATVALLLLEYRTLRDGVPGNHITAATRAAFRRAPGVFLGAIVLFVAAVSYLAGHLFWE